MGGSFLKCGYGAEGNSNPAINRSTRACHVPLLPAFSDFYFVCCVLAFPNVINYLHICCSIMDYFSFDNSCPECSEDWEPPPNNILNIPPPPLPEYIQEDSPNDSASPCAECVWAPQVPGVEFVELSRQGPSGDDPWLLVVASSVLGVLLLGTCLAIILLKCRSRFGPKTPIPPSSIPIKSKTCDATIYSYPATQNDSRLLWATITPKGTTQHFAITPPKPSLPPPEPPTFDNTGFVDSDPQTPLMESYQLSELLDSDSTSSSGGGSLRRPLRPRPCVSSPTRIEHPNLPPLNILPQHRSLRRNNRIKKDNDNPTPIRPSPLL